MPSIGPMELIIVLAIALLVLGPKRLPQVGRQLGSGMREFKGAITGTAATHADEEPERV
ncbi:MAG: Sec-independent protein translocase subunit TatA/TatB [Solirubrobacteraceae bacterium]